MKQKAIIYVTETIRHKVEIELDQEAMNELVEQLDSSNRDDVAGDMTNGRSTMQDGEYELDEYEIVEI
jgi:hypothetical protein